MKPKVPPEKHQSKQSSSSSSARAEPNEKAIETHRVDTAQAVEAHRADSEEARVTNAALFRLFADVTAGVPDWTGVCASIPLLPSRASEKRDYMMLRLLRDEQARYVDLLFNIKERHFNVATAWDLKIAKQTLRRESQKLSLLECRLEIYTTTLEYFRQAIPFNEIRLPSDHASSNEKQVVRAILTFKQAELLVDAVLLPRMAKEGKLIVDISKISRWNHSMQCYLMLDVFRRGTMQVEKRQFQTRYVQLKYFEATWPAALVAHRIEPLHASMKGGSKKRALFDDEVSQQVHNDIQQRSHDYACMLRNLMAMIQEFLLLSDDNEQSGALNSLQLVGSTGQLFEDNRICIWLEDVWR